MIRFYFALRAISRKSLKKVKILRFLRKSLKKVKLAEGDFFEVISMESLGFLRISADFSDFCDFLYGRYFSKSDGILRGLRVFMDYLCIYLE